MLKNFKIYNILYYICLLIFLSLNSILTGCYDSEQKTSQQNARKIMIAGSTSVQPIAEKLAEHYMKKHPDIKIEVQGGGSSAGVQAAKSGAASIGSCSRELKKQEQDLKETVIAYDAMVIVVHPSNNIENLSTQNICDIFSDKIKDWQQLKRDKPGQIISITREEGSGTRGSFEELVMHKTEISDRCLVEDSTGAVREIVASDPNSIGYISFGAINERVKALSVDGIRPVRENMISSDKTQKYKLIRPFLFVTKETPSGLPLEFIRYIKSEEGAKLLQQEGLIPTYD